MLNQAFVSTAQARVLKLGFVKCGSDNEVLSLASELKEMVIET